MSGTGPGGTGTALRLVLAVDDEPAILTSMGRTLRGLPIRLLGVGSAEEALEVLRIRTPAVIISDQWLPRMSGLDLLLVVRSTWPNVRAVLHTADPLARDRAALLQFPAVEKGAPHALREMVRFLIARDRT